MMTRRCTGISASPSQVLPSVAIGVGSQLRLQGSVECCSTSSAEGRNEGDRRAMTERRNRGWDLDPTSTTGERSLDQVPTTNDWKPHIKWTGVLYQKPRSCVQRMLLWPPDTSHHRHTERPTRCRWVWRQRPRLRRITNTNGETQEVDPPKREKWPNINKTRPRHTGFLVSRRLMICRERGGERGREKRCIGGREKCSDCNHCHASDSFILDEFHARVVLLRVPQPRSRTTGCGGVVRCLANAKPSDDKH